MTLDPRDYIPAKLLAEEQFGSGFDADQLGGSTMLHRSVSTDWNYEGGTMEMLRDVSDLASRVAVGGDRGGRISLLGDNDGDDVIADDAMQPPRRMPNGTEDDRGVGDVVTATTRDDDGAFRYDDAEDEALRQMMEAQHQRDKTAPFFTGADFNDRHGVFDLPPMFPVVDVAGNDYYSQSASLDSENVRVGSLTSQMKRHQLAECIMVRGSNGVCRWVTMRTPQELGLDGDEINPAREDDVLGESARVRRDEAYDLTEGAIGSTVAPAWQRAVREQLALDIANQSPMSDVASSSKASTAMSTAQSATGGASFATASARPGEGTDGNSRFGDDDGDHGLWVSRYAPKSVADLLSDEEVNFGVLQWLRQWRSHIVAARADRSGGGGGGKTGPAAAALPSSTQRPVERIALLVGPPGVGKTTLAHVAARHMGFEPLEVNASVQRSTHELQTMLSEAVADHASTAMDLVRHVAAMVSAANAQSQAASVSANNAFEASSSGSFAVGRRSGATESYLRAPGGVVSRPSATPNAMLPPPSQLLGVSTNGASFSATPHGNSGGQLKSQSISATTTTTVVDPPRRPICLILDEIDGCAENLAALLLKLDIRRPVICLANNLYARNLRELRSQPNVAVWVMRAIPVQRLVDRLGTVVRQERCAVDSGTLYELAELCTGDVRNCLNTLQFLCRSTGAARRPQQQQRQQPASAARTAVDIARILSNLKSKDVVMGLWGMWSLVFERKERSKYASRLAALGIGPRNSGTATDNVHSSSKMASRSNYAGGTVYAHSRAGPAAFVKLDPGYEYVCSQLQPQTSLANVDVPGFISGIREHFCNQRYADYDYVKTCELCHVVSDFDVIQKHSWLHGGGGSSLGVREAAMVVGLRAFLSTASLTKPLQKIGFPRLDFLQSQRANARESELHGFAESVGAAMEQTLASGSSARVLPSGAGGVGGGGGSGGGVGPFYQNRDAIATDAAPWFVRASFPRGARIAGAGGYYGKVVAAKQNQASSTSLSKHANNDNNRSATLSDLETVATRLGTYNIQLSERRSGMKTERRFLRFFAEKEGNEGKDGVGPGMEPLAGATFASAVVMEPALDKFLLIERTTLDENGSDLIVAGQARTKKPFVVGSSPSRAASGGTPATEDAASTAKKGKTGSVYPPPWDSDDVQRLLAAELEQWRIRRRHDALVAQTARRHETAIARGTASLAEDVSVATGTRDPSPHPTMATSANLAVFNSNNGPHGGDGESIGMKRPREASTVAAGAFVPPGTSPSVPGATVHAASSMPQSSAAVSVRNPSESSVSGSLASVTTGGRKAGAVKKDFFGRPIVLKSANAPTTTTTTTLSSGNSEVGSRRAPSSERSSREPTAPVGYSHFDGATNAVKRPAIIDDFL